MLVSRFWPTQKLMFSSSDWMKKGTYIANSLLCSGDEILLKQNENSMFFLSRQPNIFLW